MEKVSNLAFFVSEGGQARRGQAAHTTKPQPGRRQKHDDAHPSPPTHLLHHKLPEAGQRLAALGAAPLRRQPLHGLHARLAHACKQRGWEGSLQRC